MFHEKTNKLVGENAPHQLPPTKLPLWKPAVASPEHSGKQRAESAPR